MTSKERVKASLSHKMPDRIPRGYSAVDKVTEELINYFGISNKEQLLKTIGVDIRSIWPKYTGRQYQTFENGNTVELADNRILSPDASRHPYHFYPNNEIVDIWGVRRRKVDSGNDSYWEIVGCPLAEMTSVEELDEYLFPSPDWWDYSQVSVDIENLNAGSDEYAIMAGECIIFEHAWYMRGLEKFLVDMISNQQFAAKLLSKITDFWCDYLTRVIKASHGKVDIVYTADDIATQRGLMMSLDMFREFIKPCHTKLNKVLHQYNVSIMYHSCGAVFDAVEDLIEMGIDVLQPLQFSAKGMDPIKLKKEYGDRLSFYGGIDVQTILPNGTVNDVKKEARRLIDAMGSNGGYILAPSHNIQVDTPVENILAIYSHQKNK